MKNRLDMSVSLAALALAVGFAPATANAQSGDTNAEAGSSGIQDIVVTARRREEALQTTPLAITAVTADTLEERGIVDLSQVARIAPNFTLYETSGGIGSAGLYMRGIGYADNIPGQDSPIAIYADGVLLGRNGTAMMDIVEPERIEVLRGPQGTLFGRNTTGGAVLVTTHDPDEEFGGMVKGSYGRWNAIRMQARIDSGTLGNSGLRLSTAFSHRERSGVLDDIDRPSSRDPGANKSNSFWGKLVGEWGDARATLVGDYSELSGYPQSLQATNANANYLALTALSPSLGGGSYQITSKPQFKLQDAQEKEQTVKSKGVGLTLEYDTSEHITLKAIGGLRSFHRSDPSAYGPGNLVTTVYTGGNANIAADLFGPNPPPANRVKVSSFEGFYNITMRKQDFKQRTLELQLLGTYDRFDFVAGGYYYWDFATDQNTVRLPFPIGGTSGKYVLEVPQARHYTAHTKSIAGFAQANWRPAILDDKLELTGGVRWTEDQKQFIQTVTFARTAKFTNRNFSYLASLKYQFSPDAMAYVRYSTGFRSGGYNARAGNGADPVFEPEKLRSLEGGFKLDLLNRHLRVNAAAFFNKYHNLQVGAFVAPSATDQGGNIATNANAEYKGFEVEAEAVPVDGLTLRASFGYVDPKFKSYPTGLNSAAPQVSAGCTPINNNNGVLAAQDCAAIADFTYFAKTNVDLSAQYEMPLGDANISFLATASYKGKVGFDTLFNPVTNPWKNQIIEPGYWLIGGRITVSDIPLSGGSKAQIAVFGENLTNEIYSIQNIDFRDYTTAYYGLRRSFGIEGKITF